MRPRRAFGICPLLLAGCAISVLSATVSEAGGGRNPDPEDSAEALATAYLIEITGWQQEPIGWWGEAWRTAEGELVRIATDLATGDGEVGQSDAATRFLSRASGRDAPVDLADWSSALDQVARVTATALESFRRHPPCEPDLEKKKPTVCVVYDGLHGWFPRTPLGSPFLVGSICAPPDVLGDGPNWICYVTCADGVADTLLGQCVAP